MTSPSGSVAPPHTSTTVAALFVARGGVYWNRSDCDAWDVTRDARKYAGPWPVVAHPPCERWGRYWHGGPSAKVRRIKGDDDGCFAAALSALRCFGGVLEHPEASAAWAAFGIPAPMRTGGWTRCVHTFDSNVLWTCCVEQGHYGHRARKATWLLYCGGAAPPALTWGPSAGERLDEGFHSAEERRAARAAGVKPRPRLSTRENVATPPAFAELLINIARSARA